MATDGLIRFDWAIKRLLRNKADHAVLEGFLSVLLKEEIKIISISESESNKSHANDKYNRVDLMVEDSHGDLLIIELQNSYQVDYYFRMLYGVSKSITEYMKEGYGYNRVKKVYHINIIYFKLGEGVDYVYHGFTEFRGIHSHDLLQLTEEQKRFFMRSLVKDLFPEYYVLCVKHFNDVAKDSLDEWIYYLKNSAIPDSFTARGLKEAREQLQYNHLSKEEKRDYHHHLEQRVYEQTVLDSAELKGEVRGFIEGEAMGLEKGLIEGEAMGLEKGLIEGEAMGLEKGLIEGEAIGWEKGRAEERKKMVISSHHAGISIEAISVVTGLPPEEVILILEKNTC